MLTELEAHITSKLGNKILDRRIAVGELTITVAVGDISEVLTFLRDDKACRFEVLIDLCGVDWPARALRFDVVYHLLSPRKNQRIRVKVHTDEETPVPSVIDVFPAGEKPMVRSMLSESLWLSLLASRALTRRCFAAAAATGGGAERVVTFAIVGCLVDVKAPSTSSSPSEASRYA